MAVVRLGLFLLVALFCPIALAEEVDPWIGKVVIPKPNAALFNDGKAADIRFLEPPIRVNVTDGDRVWFTHGWMKKADLWTADEALAFSEEKINTDPKNPEVWRIRGLAWWGKGDKFKARYSLDEVVRLAPTSWQGFFDRGRFRGHCRDYFASFEDFAEAIRLDPEHPAPYLSRGHYKLIKGELTAAVEDCERAMELAPEWGMPFKLRGNVSFVKRDFKSALDDYSQAIVRGQKADIVFQNRALCWLHQGEPDRALRDADEAIRLNPRKPGEFQTRAACWIVKEEYEKAIADTTEAIRLKPTGDFYSTRGRICELLDKSQLALEDFEAATRLDLSDPKPISELSWFLASTADENVRDGNRAIELATKACEMLEWKHDSAIAGLAAGYAEVGNWERAIHFQKQAMQQAPQQRRAFREETLQLFEKRKPFRMTKAKLKEVIQFNFDAIVLSAE